MADVDYLDLQPTPVISHVSSAFAALFDPLSSAPQFSASAVHQQTRHSTPVFYTMTLRGQLRVRQAVAADIDAITQVYFAAFGPDPMSPAMYPPAGVPTADVVAKFAGSIFDEAAPGTGREVPVVVAEMLRDHKDEAEEEGYEIVAFGKYVVYHRERTEEEWTKPVVFTEEMLGQGADLDVFNGFIGGLHRKRAAVVRGAAHVYLNILAAAPDRQRLGAGSAILRWGAELADAAGLPLWLEASPTGYPLYLRHGFVPVDVLDYSLVAYGGTEEGNWGIDSVPGVAGPRLRGWYRTVVMKRELSKS
ncbi:gcn5-related n-acetyltransferase [Grosmannia clavigera kw1407]|uniref:Gcn5-related n-acetyltransferase n=1 Tax=Grosmannia clavigera (strain kw1407 / UAMH 11150) TaxID=655863 RepID=F0XPK0_GROCL|nr:gcn5-related n-acetyltransferase [Grosmannia clavigera kw1407]EFX00190.1 gcn5-related n-acetyltransferase [Grosmannia clavigera kw1407]